MNIFSLKSGDVQTQRPNLARKNLNWLAALAGVGLLLCTQPASSLAATTFTTTTNATGNWNAAASWAGGVAASGAGNLAVQGAAAVTRTLNVATTIGQVKNTQGSARLFTVVASGAIAMTFDNTGGVANQNGDLNASISSSSSGGIVFTPNIIIQNTDLELYQSGSTQPSGVYGILGTSTITATSARNLILLQNFTGGKDFTVNDSIGATGSTITVQNKGLGNANPGVILAGVVGPNAAVVQNSATSSLELAAVNTYTGATTISAGTLILGTNGSLAAASSVSIAAGGSFDVSAHGTYTLGSSATLSASGNASAATIIGGTTVSLGSRPVILTYDGSHPSLTLSNGTLQLSNNPFTIVVPGSALAAGTYVLVSTPGNPTGTPNSTPSFTGGNGIVGGATATVSVSGHNVILTVTGGGGPGPVSASHSTISPPFLSLTANGGSTQVITVQARDTNNLNLTTGGATVVFARSGTGTIGATTDNGNGTYSATLTAPASAGTGIITATLNGTSVGTLVGASECDATYFSTNFGDAIFGLTGAQTTNFTAGDAAFAKVFVVTNGLGPIFNNSACANCHNFPVDAGSGSATVKRFGLYTNGVFNPLANLGGSLLQDNSTTTNFEVVPGSANVVIKRSTTPTFGSGLIEAIADNTIQTNAAATNADHIVGVVALVTDPIDGRQHVGRFGWKNQQATLLAFTADAANNEMGITSRILPTGQAPNANTNLYNQLNTVADPNDRVDGSGRADIDRMTDYMRLLSPPPAVPLTTNAVAGKGLFSSIGCAICHTPSLPTQPNFIPVSDLAIETNAPIAALSSKQVNLYSDLLLHNMGSLADGIVQAAANTNQMRTAPLWGLSQSLPYLHDGRALTVDAAIRAHAGDAAASATRYINLSTNQQQQVVQFLNSL